MKKWLSVAVVLAAAGGGAWYWYDALQAPPRPRFRTAPVERGPFLAAVAASGVTQPIDPIDVGAQVAGRIEKLGTDPRSQALQENTALLDALLRPAPVPLPLLAGALPVKPIDFNSPVGRGTVLAQIDPSVYQSELDLAKADLDLARAELAQARSKYQQTESERNRSKDLVMSRALSARDFELARFAFEAAQADLLKAQAAVSKAEVAVDKAEINLDYTTVRSTVKGVIISRRVTVGQTVVASLNAPSLFLMAKDLRKMQIAASVNEADITQIRSGQPVRFTVESLRDEVFVGRVAEDQPRLDANMTQNVVTFTVIIEFDNSDLRLKPYMTANVKFVLDQKSSTLTVPNAALRWRPAPDQVGPAAREAYLQSTRQRRPSPLDTGAVEVVPERTVWVVDDDSLVRPVKVRVGLSDGSATEVLGGLREGDAVVVGEDVRVEAAESNPFAPAISRKKKN